MNKVSVVYIKMQQIFEALASLLDRFYIITVLLKEGVRRGKGEARQIQERIRRGKEGYKSQREGKKRKSKEREIREWFVMEAKGGARLYGEETEVREGRK